MTQEITPHQPTLPEGMTQEDIFIHLLQSTKELKQNQKTMEDDIDYLKNKQPVNPSTCLELERLRKKRVIDALGGMTSQAYKDRAFAQKVFRQAAKDFKEHFHIPRYDMLQVKDEEGAFAYWGAWEPSTNTKMEIKAINSQTSLELIG